MQMGMAMGMHANGEGHGHACNRTQLSLLSTELSAFEAFRYSNALHALLFSS